MKVLFLQDVRPTARAGDVKEVKNGFARNYLIPKGFAVHASEHELRRAAGLRQQADDRRLQEAREWQDVAEALKDEKVRSEVRTGPTGRLYGSVTNTMIAAELRNMTGREIDRKGIQIPSPIRAIGDYKIPARLIEGVSATLFVEVVADDASVELNRQLEEVSGLIVEEDKNTLDPSFEDVLAAAQADIDAGSNAESDNSEESGDGAESGESADEGESEADSEDSDAPEKASEEKSE